MRTTNRRQGAALDGVDLLVGIDDTDDLRSPGTGRHCRALMEELEAAGLGKPAGATRHQLLVDDRIPYTSHNSSACIALRYGARDPAAVVELAGWFLERYSAVTADPGLAVVAPAALDPTARADLVAFGRAAQNEVLTRPDAEALAARTGVHLSSHGGTRDGIIGALAAVGLHLSANDGMFLDLPGVRALAGSCTYQELRAQAPIDVAVGPDGAEPAPADVLDLGDWVRPLLLDGASVLLLQAPVAGRWVVQPRAVVKHRSRSVASGPVPGSAPCPGRVW